MDTLYSILTNEPLLFYISFILVLMLRQESTIPVRYLYWILEGIICKILMGVTDFFLNNLATCLCAGI